MKIEKIICDVGISDTDGDISIIRMPCGYYPFIVIDPVETMNEMLGKKYADVGMHSNLSTKYLKSSRKLTLSDLNHEWLRRDSDGVSSAEENVFKLIYGPKEKYWRTSREFFAFVAAHDNVEKIALITAAQAVYDTMRLAGEDEETVRRYKKNFVIPAMKRHQ